MHCEDAFKRKHDPYDLVYWDHSLHHMMDVDAAVAWSIQNLKPGGYFLVSDYIGPTRLQWQRAEVERARHCVAEVSKAAGQALPLPHFKTLISRIRMMIKDPSEAPQSDRIIDACKRYCGGFSPKPIGCAMINICGPLIVPHVNENDQAIEVFIEHDLEAESAGFSHFAFGIWQKPSTKQD